MKNKSAKITVFSVCILLGFLVTLQFKSVKINNEKNSYPTRTEELTQLLVEEQKRNEALNLQLDSYKTENENYRKQSEESGGAAALLSEKLRKAEILSGQCAVSGKGITVTMSDSTAQGDNIDQNPFVVHDTDILRVINELRASGAEAISINGERILATSEILCAGPVVSVNNRRYNAPFVIAAIGDPDTMEAALTLRGGILDELSVFQIEVEIEKHEKLVIDELRYDVVFQYAEPVEE